MPITDPKVSNGFVGNKHLYSSPSLMPEDPHDSEPEAPYQLGETVQGATPVHEVVEPIRVKVKPTLGDAVKIAMGVENAVRAIGMTRKSRTAMAEAGPLSLDYVDALKAWLCDQHGVTKNHLGLKPLEVDVLRQTIRAHAVNGQLVIPK
jgi:hypothetical protein